MNLKTMLFSSLVLFAWPVLGEDAAPVGQNAATDAAAVVVPEDDGFVDPVQYSAAEKKSACAKHDGKYISYYDAVYKVEKCKFREIQSSEEILSINKQKLKIYPVEGDVLAKLERGLPIVDVDDKRLPKRGCNQLEKKYITYGYNDVFYVESCKKRVFPDWTSFVEHRKKLGRQKEEILALTYAEFSGLQPGVTLPSFVDSEYSKFAIMGRNVDVIPLEVACKGLNGKDVSYVDQLYRIENCRKRVYNVELFLRERRTQKWKLVELSSEQWISLPEGKPMPVKKP